MVTLLFCQTQCSAVKLLCIHYCQFALVGEALYLHSGLTHSHINSMAVCQIQHMLSSGDLQGICTFHVRT